MVGGAKICFQNKKYFCNLTTMHENYKRHKRSVWNYTPVVCVKESLVMYVNERDQINYHGFLHALREMHQVPLGQVCKGLCTSSGMNRFERGNRMPEKQLRDRLTSRLGISGEKYEDYLQPKQYVLWEQRLRIVKAIEQRDFAFAKKELESYAKVMGLNQVNKQYVETMRFQLLLLEDAPQEMLFESVSKAIKHTVPNIENALAGEHLLADQEMNLIAEWMRLAPPPAEEKSALAWRISQYEKLLASIDRSYWEKLQKAKIYPKVVFYILKSYFKHLSG